MDLQILSLMLPLSPAVHRRSSEIKVTTSCMHQTQINWLIIATIKLDNKPYLYKI